MEAAMIAHRPIDAFEARTQVGRLYSKMMVAIVVITTIALLSLPQSHSGPEGFRGRTPAGDISAE
jgi:hypothetical protein